MISVIIPTLNAEATPGGDADGAGAGWPRRRAGARGDRGRRRIDRPDCRHRRGRGRPACARKAAGAATSSPSGPCAPNSRGCCSCTPTRCWRPAGSAAAGLFMERVDGKPARASAGVFRFALDDIGARAEVARAAGGAALRHIPPALWRPGPADPAHALRRGRRVPTACR